MRNIFIILIFVLTFNVLFSQTDSILYSIKTKPKPELINDSLNQTNLKVDTIKPNTTNKDTISVNVINYKTTKSESNFLKGFNKLFPIIMFFLGFIANKSYDWYLKRKETKAKGRRWIGEFEELRNPLKRKIEFIKSFLDSKPIENYEKPNYELFDVLNCELIYTLDKEDLRKYFELRTKDYKSSIESSSKIMDITSRIKYWNKAYVDKIQQYEENSSMVITRYMEKMNEFFAAIREYSSELSEKINPYEDSLYKKIISLLEAEISPNWEEGKYNLFELQHKFHLQITKLPSTYGERKKIKDVLESNIECSNYIFKIKQERRYLVENLNIILKEESKLINEFDEILKMWVLV